MWTLFLPSAAKRQVSRVRRSRFRPQVEALEERYCLSDCVVDCFVDSGDTQFSGGELEWDDPGDIIGTAFAVAIQPADGKIVVAGTTTSSTGVRQFSVVRYNPNGTLDTGFGSGGKATTDWSPRYAQPWDVALQADGKIVVAGYLDGPTAEDFALVRYNANGSLDTTFGKKGVATTDFGSKGWFSSRDFGRSLVIQPDGKIIEAGETYPTNRLPTAAVARFNSNGSLDTTFGSGGKVMTTMSTATNSSYIVSDVILSGNGQIVVLGSAYVTNQQRGFVLMRYNANGSLDNTFGSGGIGGSPIGPSAAEADYDQETHAWSVALDTAGRYVVGGETVTLTNLDEWVLARYTPAGSLDPSFGSGGVVTTRSGGSTSQDEIWAVAVQTDSKIVVAGQHGDTNYPNAWSFALGRYNPDGSLDTTFHGTGTLTTALGDSAFGRAVTIQPDGKIVVAGYATVNGNDVFAIARYLASAPQIGSFTVNPTPVTSGSSTTLTAANITDGNPFATIAQVAFYIDVNGSPILLGYATQTSSGVWTLTFDTTGYAPGSYTLFVQAKDNYGVLGNVLALTLTIL